MPHAAQRRQRADVLESTTTYVNETCVRAKKFTHRMFHRLKNIEAQDDNNTTTTCRSFGGYCRHFNLKRDGLIDMIVQRYQATGKKVRILDAGCGEANAIDTLLSDERLSNIVEKCVGISLHYFANVESVLSRHQKRFEFYQGVVQDILVSMPNEFDFIFDVYGACFYSKDTIRLLSAYHHVLKPGGIALMSPFGIKRMVMLEDNTKQDLKDFLISRYPKVFKYSVDKNTAYSIGIARERLSMKKLSARFPVPHYSCEMFEKVSISGEHLKGVSLQSEEAGNAIRPGSTLFKPFAVQPMKLRQLPYSKEELLTGVEKQNECSFS